MSTTNNQLKLPKLDIKKADYKEALNKLVVILMLDKKAIADVATDSKYHFPALIFLILGAIAAPLGGMLFGVRALNVVLRINFSYFLTSSLLMILTSLIAIYVMAFVAVKLFKGKGDLSNLFAVLGVAMGVRVVEIIGTLITGLQGLIGIAITIWLVAVAYITLKEQFKLDEGNSILTIIVTAVIVMIAGSIIGSLMGPSLSYGTLNLGGISLTY